jgi:cytochrome c oxidase assembly protein subunit 15
MSTFKKSALVSIALTYFLIFIGGLVRVSGAGLGCPDWPKCFGRWIPPVSLSELPADIDPSTFNMALAWIEYLNRLLGMIVGLSVLWVAVLAVMRHRKEKSILWPSLAAAVTVALQGYQGGKVVASFLAPYMVSIHMLLALLLVSLLLWAYQSAHLFEWRGAAFEPAGKGASRLMYGAIALCTIQVLSGTRVRGALETAGQEAPLQKVEALFQSISPWINIHILIGLVVFAFTFYILQNWRKSERPILREFQQSISMAVVLLILLVMLGMALRLFGLPAWAKLYHMWFTSVLLGLFVLVTCSLSWMARRRV